MELLKQHQNFPVHFESNSKIAFDSNNALEQSLESAVKNSKNTQLALMKLTKQENCKFSIGEKKPFVTEFILLNEIEDLCFKFGPGVLLFNEDFGAMVAQREVRASISNSLLNEQNGLSKETIKEIRQLFKECQMVLPFVK